MSTLKSLRSRNAPIDEQRKLAIGATVHTIVDTVRLELEHKAIKPKKPINFLK